jgi:phosphopantetheine--protein transferase-like protein
MSSALKNLPATIAGFLDLAPDLVNPNTPLNGRLNHSIGRAALDAAVRRNFRVSCRAVYSAATYGELEAAIAQSLGAEVPKPGDLESITAAKTALPELNSMTFSPGSCGIDLELIENLPVTDDYWESDFYKENFTPNEIAYCSRRDQPRQHFAARWCVKEALKKCNAAFLSQPMSALEVANKLDGGPQLFFVAGSSRRLLPYAVSLSHTSIAAVGMVCCVVDRNEPSETQSLFDESLDAKSAPPTVGFRTFDLILAIVSIISMGFAMWSAMHFI